MAVAVDPGSTASVGLPTLVGEARRRRIELPLIIRFPDILRAQVTRLHQAFRAAIARTGYANGYRCLYPVKVNPLRHVVAEILDAGREFGIGLECGSRAELAAAVSQLRDRPGPVVCNGVKDESMLALAIDAQRLGRQVIPVIQSLREFAMVRAVATERGETPELGARIRLSGGMSRGWDRTAAPDPKFGLSMADLVEALEQCPEVLRQLTLLHCHPGSQIGDLARLECAAREAAQVYATLVQRGAALRFLDVGGGLGVHYGDARDAPTTQPNYSIADYARTIVGAVNDVCRARRVPAPVLLTESGRALTAHHAVLIVPVLSVRKRRELAAKTALPPQSCGSTVLLARWARHVHGAVHGARDTKQVFDALARIEEGHRDCSARFTQGRISLEEYAVAERAFVTASRRAFRVLENAGARLPAEFRALANWLADRVVCDFSVFRSLPDHWGAGQAFPAMPIDRLNERPSSRGVLVDLTCDSDGRVDRYVSADCDASVLPMHAPRPGVTTDLAFFLMGAYEDVLGSAHNLLGRVSEIHVRLDEDPGKGYRIDSEIPATSVADMLAQMGYPDAELRASMGELVTSRVAAASMPSESGREILRRHATYLRQGTYCRPGPGAGPKP